MGTPSCWCCGATKNAAGALDIVRQVLTCHLRNDLTLIARLSQLWWPSRRFVDDTPVSDDVL
jgi:hypothetical protein